MSLDAWYNWLTFSSIVVLIGVVLEGEEVVSEFMRNGWKPVWPKLGFGLLIIGLAGEVFFQTKIESADAELKRQSDINIITAQLEAAKANERAGTLEKDAAQLKADNLALERRLAPRRIMPEQQADIGQSLKWFEGKRVVVESYGLDVEAKVLGRQIVQALKNADINAGDFLSVREPSGYTIEGIYVNGRDSDFVRELIASLKAAGLDASDIDQSASSGIIMRSGRIPPSDVDATVFVGVKPIKE